MPRACLVVLILVGCGKPPPPSIPAVTPPPAAAAVSDEDAWNTFEAATWTVAAAGEFAAALQGVREAALTFPQYPDRLTRLRERITTEARGTADREITLAGASEFAGDFLGAIAIWRKVALIGLPELHERCRDEIARIEPLEFQRKRRLALPKLGPLYLKLEEQLKGRQLDEANEDLLAFSRANPELQFEAAWLTGTVGEARGIYEAVERGCELMKGESVGLPDGPATVTSSDKTSVLFTPATGKPFKVQFGDLPPGVFIDAATRGGAMPDYLGQYMLFAGEPVLARELWKESAIRGELDAIADQVEELKAKAR